MPVPRSNDLYRLAFMCSGDPLLLLDAKGRVEDLNPAAERLVAGPTTDVRGAAVDALLRPSTSLSNLVEQAIRTRLGVPLPEGTQIDLAPDRRVDVEGRFDPLSDVGGDAIEGDAGGLLVLRDVTARRSEERDIRKREARLRAAINSARAGFALFGPDDRLIHENPMCCEIFPLRGRSMEGDTLLADVLRAVHRRGGAVLDMSEDAFVATRLEELRGGTSTRTLRVRDRWIRVDGSCTADGCTLIMHTDITAMKEAELAVERERAFVRMLLDHDPSPILVREVTGEVVFANRACAEFLGFKAEALVGRSRLPIATPQIAEENVALERQILDTVDPVTFTHTLQCSDGEVRWFTSTRMPLLVPGAPPRVFSISVDVTESQRHAEVLSGTITELKRQKREIADKLAVIEAQQALIRELSTPVLQVAEGVLAVPLIGALSDARAAEITSKLLGEIVRARAHHAILDVTAVESMDAAMADAFVRMASAIQLLGARAVVTGIQPTVAQSIADLGLDLRGITTCGNLRAGLDLCLRARARA